MRKQPLAHRPPAEPGFVYVLTNPAFRTDRVKIGGTGRTGEDRRRELSKPTAVPEPYVLAWEHPVTDWKAIERLAQDGLQRCRPNENREFFLCSVRTARRVIRREARAYLRPWWWQLLFHRRALRAAQRQSGSVNARKPRPRRWPKGDNRLPLLLGLSLVLCVIAMFKPDIGWLPDGAIARTIRWIENPYR